MWRLYAEYGRDNASKGVVGVLGTVLAHSLGLIPAFVLGLAIDAIFLDQRPFSLPLVPSEWIPTGADGQLVFAIGLIVGATVLGAAVTWAQNWGLERFRPARPARLTRRYLRGDAGPRYGLFRRAPDRRTAECSQ